MKGVGAKKGRNDNKRSSRKEWSNILFAALVFLSESLSLVHGGAPIHPKGLSFYDLAAGDFATRLVFQLQVCPDHGVDAADVEGVPLGDHLAAIAVVGPERAQRLNWRAGALNAVVIFQFQGVRHVSV